MRRRKTVYEFKVWVDDGFHRVSAFNIVEAVGAVLSAGVRAEEIYKVEMVYTPELNEPNAQPEESQARKGYRW